MVLTGKKGVFFTFIACIFLSLLIFSSNIGNNYEMRQKSFVIETRVDTMNRFIKDIERDIERVVYISGFRSLIAMEENVLSSGKYLSNISASFNGLFFNGTINGTNVSVMQNNTFADWMNKMQREANKIDIVLNFTVRNLSLSQDDPWKAKVTLGVGINATDKEGLCGWSKEKSLSAYVEFDNFQDPFYTLGTNGVVDNRIERTPYTDFVQGSDISNLLNHTYGGYYIEFSGAPSYLMRLQGNFGSSMYGIESLVDVGELVSKGVSAKDKSIIDYFYFGTQNPAYYHVSGAPNWLHLDNSTNAESNQTHLQLYEAEGLAW